MKQDMKEQLRQIYSAPRPQRKQEFILREGRNISMVHMLKIQLYYMTRKTWILSILFFVGMVWLGRAVESQMVGAVFGLTPFLGLITTAESMRSITHNMSELEMSCRFSLKSVMMAKMVLLGMENLLLMLAAAVFVKTSFLQSMVYLIIPYLINASGNLILVRKVSQQEAVYACGALAGIVSMGELVIASNWQWIYEAQYVGIWGMAGIFLAVITGKEICQTIGRMEELTWN